MFETTTQGWFNLKRPSFQNSSFSVILGVQLSGFSLGFTSDALEKGILFSH